MLAQLALVFCFTKVDREVQGRFSRGKGADMASVKDHGVAEAVISFLQLPDYQGNRGTEWWIPRCNRA